MMSAYDLSEKSRKAIASYSRDEYYVYIRPTTSRYSEPNKKVGQWWVVSVQIRGLPPHEYREEGRSLDECFLRLSERVPSRDELHEYRTPGHVRTDYIGYLAPHALWLEKYQSIMEDNSASDLLKSAYKATKKGKSRGVPVERMGQNKPESSTVKGHGKPPKKKKKGKK